MTERLLVVDVWHNMIVLQKSRPSELVPLLGLLYGRPGAEERWERYLVEMEAWQEKRRKLYDRTPAETAFRGNP